MLVWLIGVALAADPPAPPAAPPPPVCEQWEITMFPLNCAGGVNGLPWFTRKKVERRTCTLPDGWEPITAAGLMSGGTGTMGTLTEPYVVLRRCVTKK